jgi:hypothetical protein
MKTKIAFSNGVEVILTTSKDETAHPWQANYRTSMKILKSVNEYSSAHEMSEIRLPIDNTLRRMFHDRRYKYFKIKLYRSNMTSLSSVLRWEAMAFININLRMVNKNCTANFIHDHGTWEEVIMAFNRYKLKEQFKTNTTVI